MFSIRKTRNAGQPSRSNARGQAGFSVVELLIVAAVVCIMSAFALFAMQGHKDKYRSDDEIQRILDVMRESSQLALTHRRSMRLELNATQKWIRIVDENNTVSTTDDVEVRRVPLQNSGLVKVDVKPSGVNAPNPPNYATAAFASSVWTLRYKLDGTVERTNGTVTSATLYVYPPSASNANVASNNKAVRALTIFGGTGAIKLWKYNGSTFTAY